ncbi:MAG: diacylglycerol kinase family lipid kinase [Dehalococcoidia bacterium]|nr:MAG: diacylglycerol kinase family lipid kinase [Dehalococcoidia bacterium]
MYFLVNPGAGRGRGRKALKRVKSVLGPGDILAISQGPGDCERLAREAAAAGHPAITVVSGDGTVGEVINGIAASGFQTSLGVLPVGTGNDFAASLGIPKDLNRALAIARAGHTRRVDLGVLVRGNERRYFATTAGAGLSAVVASLAQSETDKAAGSPVTYIPNLGKALLRFQPVELEITTEEFIYQGKSLQASVSNCQTEGGFWLMPGARPDDGFLHMLILGNVPRWQRPWYVLQIIRGKGDSLAKAHRHRVQKVTLASPDALPFYLDGEYLPLAAGEKVEIQVEEGRLTAIAP